MTSFFYNLYKLLAAVWHGCKNDDEFRIMIWIMVTLIFSGTFFYSYIEGWSIVDSVYFCVMTMSTIGYGDLVPTTDVSKLFTIVYAMLSIGVFVTLMSKLVMIIVERKKSSKVHMKNLLNELHRKNVEPDDQ